MATDKRSPTVFYSWQSDLPNKTNRGLIREALEKACKDLSAELEVRVDSDIQGESGSPDIATTILEKIDKATVFVADVSIVGIANIANSSTNKTRPVPNPNVMIELGYAKKSLGAKRVIMVCNTAFSRVEELPFDIRGRSVVAYSFNDDDGDKPAGPRNDLRGKLKLAIEAAIKAASDDETVDPLIEEKRLHGQTETFQRLRVRLVQEILTNPPVPLISGHPIMALHLAPVDSLDGKSRVNLQTGLSSLGNVMVPYAASSWRHVHHEDSITTVGAAPGQPTIGYTRLFESGVIQYVMVIAAGTSKNINSIAYASIEGLTRILPAPERLQLTGKFFVSLDLLHTQGAQFSAPPPWNQIMNEGRQIEGDSLSPPAKLVDSSSSESAQSLLKPLLDRIWRAGGFEKCFLFDRQGRFIQS